VFRRWRTCWEHGDIFDLPQQAALLASTLEIPQQIFEWGNRVLAFQCHPEIRASAIEAWLIRYACVCQCAHGEAGTGGTFGR
jgi:GMP synthase-like glutamine amidotransferase